MQIQKYNNMIKVTEKNRGLVFLAATMLIGLLLIGVQMYRESDDIKGDTIFNEGPKTPFKELENKIENLKNQNFDPTSYNTLASEIGDSFRQDLITSSAKNNLMSNLSTVYSDLVYSRCEFYLTGNNLNSSTEVLNWLQQLENITSRNSKIDFYRGQINAYLYYSETLPNKVNDFISPGITNYDPDTYNSLKEEVINMSKLRESYKNRSKFSAIRKNLTSDLEKFNADWATAGASE